MSANLTDTDEFTLLHFSAQFGLLEETKDFFTKRCCVKQCYKIYGAPPLIVAAQSDQNVSHSLPQIDSR